MSCSRTSSLLTRLNRIAGRSRGILQHDRAGCYCVDILTQISVSSRRSTRLHAVAADHTHAACRGRSNPATQAMPSMN